MLTINLYTLPTCAYSCHCTFLLHMQPIFSPSILVDMMRPDGSSAISVLNGEALSADLAHELLGVQVL